MTFEMSNAIRNNTRKYYTETITKVIEKNESVTVLSQSLSPRKKMAIGGQKAEHKNEQRRNYRNHLLFSTLMCKDFFKCFHDII